MSEAIEQGGGHLGVTKDGGPFAEAEVGGDRHAGALIELAQQMEQKRPARGAEGQIAKFIQDHEVELGQALGDLPCLALGFFLFEGIDQLDGGEEPDLSAVMFDGLDTEGGGNMGLAGARAADQHHVLRPIHELAAVQGSDGGLVDLAGSKVEAGEILVGREARGLHVIGDGTHFTFGQFRLQQL